MKISFLFLFVGVVGFFLSCGETQKKHEPIYQTINDFILRSANSGRYTDEKLDSVEIKNLEIKPASAKDYYHFWDSVANFNAVGFQETLDYESNKISQDSIVKTKNLLNFYTGEKRFIDDFLLAADTTPKLYKAEFALDIVSSTMGKVSMPLDEFFYQKDLSYFGDMDSLYRASLKK